MREIRKKNNKLDSDFSDSLSSCDSTSDENDDETTFGILSSRKMPDNHKKLSDNNNSRDQVPFLVNLFVNIIITFSLSLSIYLLIGNVYLTLQKSSTNLNSFQNNFAFPKAKIFDNSFNELKNEIFYDCSKKILTNEECDQLNSYHNKYLNSLRYYLSNIDEDDDNDEESIRSKTTITNFKKFFALSDTLKVNTSFFIH
ncbi:unnamed protein product [Brachionus calyciflorus]|uniref:Uncharacterized protein n=1 Tax=Brachionus calyciflorus TaxID=104777 RepID=A0A813MGS0_9BILA|nr:unnamed protein product [Brachionus calyciflorus]